MDSSEYTYEKRLAIRNTEERPAKKTGEVHPWFTKEVQVPVAVPVLFPDQWEGDTDNKGDLMNRLEPLPEELDATPISEENVIIPGKKAD